MSIRTRLVMEERERQQLKNEWGRQIPASRIDARWSERSYSRERQKNSATRRKNSRKNSMSQRERAYQTRQDPVALARPELGLRSMH